MSGSKKIEKLITGKRLPKIMLMMKIKYFMQSKKYMEQFFFAVLHLKLYKFQDFLDQFKLKRNHYSFKDSLSISSEKRLNFSTKIKGCPKKNFRKSCIYPLNVQKMLYMFTNLVRFYFFFESLSTVKYDKVNCEIYKIYTQKPFNERIIHY